MTSAKNARMFGQGDPIGSKPFSPTGYAAELRCRRLRRGPFGCLVAGVADPLRRSSWLKGVTQSNILVGHAGSVW